jgi:hypothetical protein
MIKLVFDLINKIADKIFSARFLITVMIGITYCHVVAHCVHHYLESLKSNPGQLEAFVTGVFMGFSSVATFVIKAYFDRADRADEAKPTQSPGSIIQSTTTTGTNTSQEVKT